MKIQFLGAAKTVTGSCFKIDVDGIKFLIDCGMFQGEGYEERNYQDFLFDPSEIDFVVVTHSHLDHCGLLPKLYKEGFRGRIYVTIPTRSILEYMLTDSAKVQEIKYREANKKSKSWKLKLDQGFQSAVPLYDTNDVMGTLGLLETIEYSRVIKEKGGIGIKFLRVGHALGAASVELTIQSEGKKLIFSGDIGNSSQKLDSNFDFPREADFIVMESLYGGEFHYNREKAESDLIQLINQTVEEGGNVLLPAFTYQRSQELLMMLKRFLLDNKIPRDVKVVLDSPLAIKVTNVYKKYYRYLNKKLVERYSSGENMFSSENFIFVKDNVTSRRLRRKKGRIILAGHGMCAGGRILSHLILNLPDKKSSLAFVGYQAEGTLGRELLKKPTSVSVDGRKVKVNASIHDIDGFSAHADQNDLFDWLKHINKENLKKIFLVHSDEERSRRFLRYLENKSYKVMIPEWKQTIDLIS